MSKVVWLPEALEDTQRLRLFLDEKNPTAAARVGKILQEGEEYLADFPEIGSPMSDGTDRRELFLPFGTGGYILRYITDKQTVAIIRVWHTKENRDDTKQPPAKAGGCFAED